MCNSCIIRKAQQPSDDEISEPVPSSAEEDTAGSVEPHLGAQNNNSDFGDHPELVFTSEDEDEDDKPVARVILDSGARGDVRCRCR